MAWLNTDDSQKVKRKTCKDGSLRTRCDMSRKKLFSRKYTQMSIKCWAWSGNFQFEV